MSGVVDDFNSIKASIYRAEHDAISKALGEQELGVSPNMTLSFVGGISEMTNRAIRIVEMTERMAVDNDNF